MFNTQEKKQIAERIVNSLSFHGNERVHTKDAIKKRILNVLNNAPEKISDKRTKLYKTVPKAALIFGLVQISYSKARGRYAWYPYLAIYLLENEVRSVYVELTH